MHLLLSALKYSPVFVSVNVFQVYIFHIYLLFSYLFFLPCFFDVYQNFPRDATQVFPSFFTLYQNTDVP